MKRFFFLLLSFLMIMMLIGCNQALLTGEGDDDDDDYSSPSTAVAGSAKNVILYLGSTFTNIGDDLMLNNYDRIADISATLNLTGNTSGSAQATLTTRVEGGETYYDQVFTFTNYAIPNLTINGSFTVQSKFTLSGDVRPITDVYNDSVVTATNLTINGTSKTVTTLSDIYDFGIFEELTANMTPEEATPLALLESLGYGLDGDLTVTVVLNSESEQGTATVEFKLNKNANTNGLTGTYLKCTFDNYANTFDVDGNAGTIAMNGSLTVTPTVTASSITDFAKLLQGETLPETTKPTLDFGFSISGNATLSIAGVNIAEVGANSFKISSLSYLKTYNYPDMNYLTILPQLSGSIIINNVKYSRDNFENYIILDEFAFDQWVNDNPGKTVDSPEFKEFKLKFKVITSTIYATFSTKLHDEMYTNPDATSFTVSGTRGGSATLDKATRTVTFTNYKDNDITINGSYIYDRDFEYDYDSYTSIIETTGSGLTCTGSISGTIAYDFTYELANYIDYYVFTEDIVPAVTDSTDLALLNSYYYEYYGYYNLARFHSYTDCKTMLDILTRADASSDSYDLWLPYSVYINKLNLDRLTVAEKAIFDQVYTSSGTYSYSYNNSVDDNSADYAEALDILAKAGYWLADTYTSFDHPDYEGYKLNDILSTSDFTTYQSYYSGPYGPYGSTYWAYDSSTDSYEQVPINYTSYSLTSPSLPDADEAALLAIFESILYTEEGETTETITIN